MGLDLEGNGHARLGGIRITPGRRLAFFVSVDIMLLGGALFLATLLRFDGLPPRPYRVYVWDGALLAGLLVTSSFAMGTYRASWSFVGLREIGRVAAAVTLSSLFSVILLLVARNLAGAETVSLAVNVIQAPIAFCALAGFRLSKRAVRVLKHGSNVGLEAGLIIGGGPAGAQVLKSVQESGPREPLSIIGFIDDDPLAGGTSIHGVRVLGPLADLERHIRATRASVVIICLEHAGSAQVQEIVSATRAAGVNKIRILPTYSELLGGKVSFSATREVTLDDLLGRDPVQTDLSAVRGNISGRSVLVTGGAGTIGAELCRQVAHLGPRKLIILDVDETRIHDLALELRDKVRDVEVVQALVDVRDRPGLDDTFARHTVQVVFHAAAYKHVPMMEEWPLAALEVNVLGTANVVEAARAHGAERFVLISTDKAVEPSNVMGASKRLAELALFGERREGLTVAAVRFGNVLGSRGSVLPTFERQIRAGGPITVTHPEVERYFMMTSEAVQLVLQTTVLSDASEIFVLDMGKPVRIVDVAREFIRLHGLEPEIDIPIRFIGLRPGEKLSESLHYSDEVLAPTRHPRILRTNIRVAPAGANLVREVEAIIEGRDPTAARTWLVEFFPSLRSAFGSDDEARSVGDSPGAPQWSIRPR